MSVDMKSSQVRSGQVIRYSSDVKKREEKENEIKEIREKVLNVYIITCK